MAKDNELIITAGLDIPKTTDNISKDLKNVSDRLNSDHALKIICNIDVSKTTQAIQSQLAGISKNLSLDIGNVNLNSIQNNISRQTKGLEVKAKIKTEIDKKSTAEKIKELEKSFDAKQIKGNTQEILQSYKESLGGERATAIEEANGQLKKFAIYVNASENTTEKLTFKLNKLGNAFEYVGKTIHEANNSTDLRKKPVDVSRDIQIGELDKFSMKVASSGSAGGVDFNNKIQELRDQLDNVFDTSSLNAFLNAFSRVKAEFESFDSVTSSINDSIKQLSQMSLNANLSKNSSDPQVQNQIQIITELREECEKLLQEVNETNDVKALTDIESKFHTLSSRILEAQQSTDSLASSLKKSSELETLSNRIRKTIASMDTYANSNKKAISSTKLMSDGVTTFAEKWDELTSRMKSGNLSADEFKHLNEEVATFKNEVKAAGLDSGAFFRKMGDQVRLVVTQWISLNAVIGKTREMISNVINIDNAMVNLKKVTNETDDTYEKFLNKTDVRAKKLHSTMSDLIEQTSEWSKLGFDLNEASELAETSMIYSKVGEVDNQTAVSDLVAIMKAFNIEAGNSISIVDALNKLGNEFATDSKSLGDGLSVSASTLAIAGNDLSQSLALLTGGTEITQDANAMGNALRVISMRIRGMKGELEALNEDTDGIESISKIQTQILNLTGNKVNIFDSNNQFRSTYDILKDISEVYNDLSDPSRADLTEILFGKNRANQGIAVIQAFQSGKIEDAYEAAKNSSGSALAEFEELSESIESHINDFREAWENLSNDFIKSDFLKTVIDSGTKLIDVLDILIKQFGAFPTIIGAIAGGLSFKGVGEPKNRIRLIMHCCKLKMHDESHLLKIK